MNNNTQDNPSSASSSIHSLQHSSHYPLQSQIHSNDQGLPSHIQNPNDQNTSCNTPFSHHYNKDNHQKLPSHPRSSPSSQIEIAKLASIPEQSSEDKFTSSLEESNNKSCISGYWQRSQEVEPSIVEKFSFLQKPIKESIKLYIKSNDFSKSSTDRVRYSQSIAIDLENCCLTSRLKQEKRIILFEKHFDHNAELVETISKKLLDNIKNKKINSLLFNIGVYGSGKSVAMFGDSENPGILQSILDDIPNCKLISFEVYQNNIYSLGQSKRVLLKPRHKGSLEFVSYQPFCVNKQSEKVKYCLFKNASCLEPCESIFVIIEYHNRKIMLVDFNSSGLDYYENKVHLNLNPCFKAIANSLFNYNPKDNSWYEENKILWVLSFFLKHGDDVNVLGHLNNQESNEHLAVLKYLEKIQNYQPFRMNRAPLLKKVEITCNLKVPMKRKAEDKVQKGKIKENRRKQVYKSMCSEEKSSSSSTNSNNNLQWPHPNEQQQPQPSPEVSHLANNRVSKSEWKTKQKESLKMKYKLSKAISIKDVHAQRYKQILEETQRHQEAAEVSDKINETLKVEAMQQKRFIDQLQVEVEEINNELFSVIKQKQSLEEIEDQLEIELRSKKLVMQRLSRRHTSKLPSQIEGGEQLKQGSTSFFQQLETAEQLPCEQEQQEIEWKSDSENRNNRVGPGIDA